MTADDQRNSGGTWSLDRIDLPLRLALLLFLLIAASYLLPFAASDVMQRVDDYVAELLLLSATVLLFAMAALRGRDTATRQFWWLLCASFGCWLAGRLLGLLIRAESAWLFNFSKDLLLLAHSCLVVVAADLRPGLIKSSLQTLRARLAALSSVLLIVGIFGYAALVPALAGIEDYESPFVVYAVLDVYIAIRFLVQGLRATSRSWQSILMLVATGFFLISAADLLVVAFDSGVLAYQPGQPLNLAWFLFYVPLFFASRVAPGSPQILPRSERADWSDSLDLAPILAYSIAIPLIHLLGYGLELFSPQSRMVRDIFVLCWLVGASIGICWQFVLLHGRLRAAEASKIAAQTEAGRLQSQLRQAQRIELVGQLTGGLAHEFGNSLFGAESFAQKILRDARQQDGVITEEHAVGLVDALAGSRELVRKFNYLGRGDDVESAVVDLADEVRTTLDLLRPGIAEGIRLNFHCDYDDIGVIARKQDLQQLTINLVLNARDAIADTGFIDVSVGQGPAAADSCTSCGAMITGEHVWLRVSDSGPGVPPYLRQRIFEPLVTSKPAGQGSGLGLSIVHTLVHQLRGHIVLSDPQPAHCSFTIHLPAVQLDVSGPLLPGPAGVKHVLIVEADQGIAAAFRRDPSLHTLHVNRVTSADAAGIILQQAGRVPDTVIIGNMPNPVDAVAVVDEARGTNGTRVILCARPALRSILETLDGIDSFLDQPVDADIFASVILKRAAA